jgi:hypothetical protein
MVASKPIGVSGFGKAPMQLGEKGLELFGIFVAEAT